MNEQIREAIEVADAQVNNFGLPTYSELVAAAKLALRAIDSRISATEGEISDDEIFACEALCRVLVGALTEDNV